jgi:DNA processing protein
MSDAELRALLQLRMLRVPDDPTLNQLLAKKSPTEIAAEFCISGKIDHTIATRVELALRELRRSDTQIVKIGDAAYPKSLDRLEHLRPPVLFCRGNIELLKSRIVAIIGTRRSTEYGNEVAEMLAHDVARKGITVISGLALGIDTFAHRGALAAEGNTIAVLGCGIDVYYPHRNTKLQDRIATEGLLISEFAPGEPAMPHHFLQRNRLIALLGRGVVVVEASFKSGTNHTVEWALNYGVDVFAVPGPIGYEASKGTNALIYDGSPIITCSRDLFDLLPWRVQQEVPRDVDAASPVPLESAHARVYSGLGPVAVQINTIARGSGLDPAAALAILAELELDGLVQQLPGKRFMRTQIRTSRGQVGSST